MPKVMSRKTSHVQPAFVPYDGDNPPAGMYRGVLKQLKLQKASTGSTMFFAVVELAAKDGSSKKQYDGFAAMGNLVLGESDIQVEREQGLYKAICGKSDVDVSYDSAFDKFKDGDKQRANVEKIGGVKPEGKVVLVRLVNGTYNGAPQLQMDGIYPVRGEDDSQVEESADPDEDIEVDVDEEDDEEALELYTEEELSAKSLAALRKILVDEFEMDAAEAAKLKQKAKLIEAILEAQAELPEDEEEPEDDEEEVDEDEDEDEDEEEDEDDPEAALREELKGLTRVQLKARLKKSKGGAEFKVTTKMTDDDLRDKIVEFEDVPF